MSCARDARKLANYISSLADDFVTFEPLEGFTYDHIGALLTDVVLQAGLNYSTVVKPRVQNILLNYPDSRTVIGFLRDIESYGISHLISWSHATKQERLLTLVEYCLVNSINNCHQLKAHVILKRNQDELLQLKGIGFKTVDYLLNFST